MARASEVLAEGKGQQGKADRPAAPAAQKEAPPPVDYLDHYDFPGWALAKEMHQTWSADVGKRHN